MQDSLKESCGKRDCRAGADSRQVTIWECRLFTATGEELVRSEAGNPWNPGTQRHTILVLWEVLSRALPFLLSPFLPFLPPSPSLPSFLPFVFGHASHPSMDLNEGSDNRTACIFPLLNYNGPASLLPACDLLKTFSKKQELSPMWHKLFVHFPAVSISLALPSLLEYVFNQLCISCGIYLEE